MRLLGMLFVVIVVLAILGLVRGWFIVETANAADQSRTRVVVDEDKVAADARKAAAKVEELSDKVIAVFKSKGRAAGDGSLTVDAEVKSVDAAARRIDLRVDGEELGLQVPATASITAAGQTRSLSDVTTGQRVRVTMAQGAQRMRIERIELL